jgi:hypothetical protein
VVNRVVICIDRAISFCSSFFFFFGGFNTKGTEITLDINFVAKFELEHVDSDLAPSESKLLVLCRNNLAR